MKILQIFIMLFIFLLNSCGGGLKETSDPDADKNETIQNQDLPDIESKYMVDKNGNILDKNGNILDNNAHLDKNKNIVDKDGRVIDRFGNLLDSYGNVIGVYVPPKKTKLLLALGNPSFNLQKHDDKNININGVSYVIQYTLTTSTQRKIGISNSVKKSFFGPSDAKKFVFSPSGYVAVIRSDIRPENFFRRYDSLHSVNIIFNISNNFSFSNNQVMYESFPNTQECLSNIPNEFMVYMYFDSKKIGHFSLKCDIGKKILKNIKNKTVFLSNHQQSDYFLVKLDGNTKEYRVDTLDCYTPQLDSEVPPLPSSCIINHVN